MIPRIVLYCLLGGLPLTLSALGTGHAAWWWLSGSVLAAAFAPIARFGPHGALRQFAVIAPVLLIVSHLCTWSEAVIFLPWAMPDPWDALTGGAVMYVIVAIVLASLAAGLRVTRPDGGAVEHRPPAAAALMVVISGAVYALAYLVFGSITYFFFTRAYYPEANADQRAPGPLAVGDPDRPRRADDPRRASGHLHAPSGPRAGRASVRRFALGGRRPGAADPAE